ncbi:MAG: DUF4249 family protein [Rhodothermales bacterium]|nr:DUF4249 family protein [Rhodothermales bacterium]
MNVPRFRSSAGAALLRSVLLCSVLLCSVLLFSACDDTFVDPFDNDGRIFSVFGYLDAFAFEQKVRVIAIKRYPERIHTVTDDQAFIDARVHSTNLVTGQIIHWNHSLRQLDDGRYAHIFSAGFQPREGHEYRLTVTRNDGRTATAETEVPYHFTSTPIDFDPVSIRRRSSASRIPVRIEGLPSVGRILVRYRVSATDTSDIVLEKRLPMEISYGRSGGPDGSGGWRFYLDIPRDGRILADRIRQLQSEGKLGMSAVHVYAMTIQIQMLDDQWIPIHDDVDIIELSQPGAFTNVENGYGYWGAMSSILQDFDLGPSYNSAFGL